MGTIIKNGINYGASADAENFATKAELEITDTKLNGLLNANTGERLFNALRVYKKDNLVGNVATATITFGSGSHCFALLMIDNNSYTDVYTIGVAGGVREVNKSSSTTSPTLNTSTRVLTVPMSNWSQMVLFTFDRVTIV